MSNTYALITNGIVTNLVTQDTEPPAEFNPVNTTVAQIGWTYVNGVFSAPVVTPYTPTLTEVTAVQIAELQASYKLSINQPVVFKNSAGVTSSYPAGGTETLNGATAAQNLNNVIVSGASAWTLGKWLDVLNAAQTFTFADLQGLAAAMEAQEVIAWQNLEVKAAMVQSATTIAQVQAIIF